MTKQEFYEITRKMQAIYTNQRFMEKQETFEVWYALFKDVPFDAVAMAVQAHVMSCKFPPTPADITEQLQKLKRGNSSALPTAEEAWAFVRKAASNAGYHAEEEFGRLPDIAKRAVGTPENLKAWAMMEIDQFETVQKSHFVRVYNGLVEREKSEERLPLALKQVIESAREMGRFKEQRTDIKAIPDITEDISVREQIDGDWLKMLENKYAGVLTKPEGSE